MHLKPYPKVQKNDRHLEPSQENTRVLRVDPQGEMRRGRGLRQACALTGSPGNGTANRYPLGVLSANPLCCSGAPSPSRLSVDLHGPWAHGGQASLLLLSSCSLSLCRADGPLDIWAVIKPGNTREKIAIFASAPRSQDEPAPGGDEARTLPVKIKGCWEGECSVAKRRRRSGRPEKAPCPEGQPAGDDGSKVQGEEGKVLSVVEMVAYLEQMASDQQAHSKPARSAASITLSKVGSLPAGAEQPGAPESQEEDGEFVRVLDMVAKLESECLKQQGVREGGDLSRNNSLRRGGSRVLLAGPEALKDAPAAPQDSSELVSPTGKPGGSPHHWASVAASPAPDDDSDWRVSVQSVAQGVRREHQGPGQPEEISSAEAERAAQPLPEQPSGNGTGCHEEPLPGMLFFPPSVPQREASLAPRHAPPTPGGADSGVRIARDLKEGPCSPEPSEPWRRAQEREAEFREPVSSPLLRVVSHDFLETRFQIQLLLEPQQYMAFLPHHVLVAIFCFLPTQTLAALKCTCHFFKFIIESYGVRPADSRWVCDPRYKDDPCKQCKRRYGRGDVSLCRWHHKPYCQALPYGPGYWMCCHGSHRDTPGCNVGLHDNRWVPAFHSINMPIYMKSREHEEEA